MDSIINAYKYLNEDLASPVTKDWFLISSPWPILSIVAVYLTFCKVVGPYLMRDRKPFDLKKVIMLYNLFQVVVSSVLVYEGCLYIFHKEYNPTCQGPDDVNSPRAFRIALTIYAYFALKIIELLDTVFFIMRKSFRQVSSLHLHHHSLMPFVSWVAVKYVPGGQCVLIGWINSFVHVIMYGYYLLAGLGPQYKKYLWWKKYVTLLQLIQFGIIFVHTIVSLFYTCDYAWFFKIMSLVYAVVFMNMFGQFYYYNYVKKSTQNGTTNGVKNGVSNGVKNGVSNGVKNGVSNGVKNGTTNGVRNGVKKVRVD